MKSKDASKAADTTWSRTKAAENNFKNANTGYKTYHSGWPDFVAFNEKTGDFCFVECKRMNEYNEGVVPRILRGHQNEVRKILEKITKKKFKYEIWFFRNEKASKKILKKAYCDGDRLKNDI